MLEFIKLGKISNREVTVSFFPLFFRDVILLIFYNDEFRKKNLILSLETASKSFLDK